MKNANMMKFILFLIKYIPGFNAVFVKVAYHFGYDRKNENFA